MPELKADIVVLGAGMVGVGAALHLQSRGRDVMLVDRHGAAGEETSYGNAGLIECASVFPRMFPRDFGSLLKYALNRAPQVRYRFADLPEFLPWLLRYYLASSPEGAMKSAMAELPLIRRSLVEHEALIAEAGVPELLKRTGWLKTFRSEATLGHAVREFERAKQYGVTGDVLDAKGIATLEPNLSGEFAGAVFLPTPGFVPDPGGLVILDYKTGGVPKADEVALGLSPQLPLEALIAEAGGFENVEVQQLPLVLRSWIVTGGFSGTRGTRRLAPLPLTCSFALPVPPATSCSFAMPFGVSALSS